MHTGVIKLAAVVGRREERDELPLRKELVAVLDHLMRAADQVELVLRQELTNHLMNTNIIYFMQMPLETLNSLQSWPLIQTY